MLILPTLLALDVLPVTLPRLLADPPLPPLPPPEIEDAALLPILLPHDTMEKIKRAREGEAERTRAKLSETLVLQASFVGLHTLK